MQTLALLVLGTLLSQAASSGQQDDPGWSWFSTCGGPTMTIEITLHGATVGKVTTPVCRAPRESQSTQGRQGRVDFSFRSGRPLVWEGYRDQNDRTPAGQVIEAALWQAGAEPDAILVGVSFSTSDRILINTIHIAYPDRRTESTIAAGLTVSSYPAGGPKGQKAIPQLRDASQQR